MNETKTKKSANTQQKEKDARMWAMLCHLSALAGFVIPFGNVIAPLIIWSIKKDEFELVKDQGKEALNFQISILIYLFASAILIVAVVGILLLIVVGLFWLIFTVIAAIKANEGEKYQYPLCIRFIK
jgi:uncharacterized Tic20 family protein